MTIQVLVVDDVQAMAEQYAYDLKRVGKYDTIVAAGGGEALDLLGREPIDCVVLDLEMPGTDGFDVLRGLQQRGIDTPVIVYTGTGSYDRCVQAVRPCPSSSWRANCSAMSAARLPALTAFAEARSRLLETERCSSMR